MPAPRPRRVAVVTTSYPSFSGDPAGHFVAAEVHALEEAGAAVHLVAPPAGGAFGWPGVAARLEERPWRAFEAGAWVLRATRELERARRESGLDLIVAHWAVPSAWPIVTRASLRGVPLEVVSHGGDVRLLRKVHADLRNHVVRSVAARAATWRFVSAPLLEELLDDVTPRTRDVVARVARVAPSALARVEVAPEAIGARRASIGDRPLYVCAARLVASKRVDKVIDYVAGKPRALSSVLVVLGDGPERRQLEEQAYRWRMDARFLGTTPRDETLSWIGAADELVHASRAEGLSTVLREAAELGVKVTCL